MPEQGAIESFIDRLTSYISEVDKNWVNSIKPASRESVDQLKRTSRIEEKGHGIPTSYQKYLEYMGENDGGLLSDYIMADTSLTMLCDYYNEELNFEPESINPEILVFGLSHMADQLSFDLRHNEEPVIIESVDGEIYERLSENFEKLLFQSAFNKVEKIRFPFYAPFGGSQDMLKAALKKGQTEDIFEIVNELAEREKFSKAWFSDFRHYIGHREDIRFMVEDRKGSMTLIVFGTCEHYVTSIGNVLASAIGAK